MDDVFGYVESNRQRFLDELCALLRQPSISTQDVGVRECAELVRRFMTEAGADAHIDKMAKKYIGKDKYPWRGPNEVRVLVKVAPEKVHTMG